MKQTRHLEIFVMMIKQKSFKEMLHFKETLQ